MFKALLGLAEDLVEVADTAISVPVNLVRGATKPMADVAKEIKQEVEDLIED